MGRLEECRSIACLKKFARFKTFEVGYFKEQLFLTLVEVYQNPVKDRVTTVKRKTFSVKRFHSTVCNF